MSASLPAPGSTNALYLIDLSGYVFRAYHAIPPLSGPTGEPTHATLGTLTMIHRLINERQPTMLAAAMDSRTPSFRAELDGNYKANRPAPPEDLSIQIKRTRELLDAHRIHIWQQDGVEADDIIASAVQHALLLSLQVVIVSADKDLMQLVGPSVVMWDTMRDKVYGPAEVEAKFGVPPAQLRDLLALTGDSSDNIPGVPSVGLKTAAKLLQDFGSLDGVYAQLDQVPRPRLREMLTTHRNDALLSRQLVTLRTDLDLTFEPHKLRYGPPNTAVLIPVYRELGFARLLESLPQSAPPPPASVYNTILTEAELSSLVSACQHSGRMALSAKTDGPNAMRARLVGIAISYQPGQSFYIPLEHRYLNAPAQLPLPVVRSVLSKLIESTSVIKVGHDLKFDDIVLRRHGFPPLQGVGFDAMIGSYLLDPEDKHELAEIARRELSMDMMSFDQVTEKSRGRQLGFDEVMLDRATEFACSGADASLRLADQMMPRLEAQGLRPLLDDVEIPLSYLLADIEMTGVLVDNQQLQSLGDKFEAQMQALEVLAKQQAGRDFNVNSPRQLECILFDELKLPVVKRTKTARSTDASVLEALTDAHPLVGTIVELRQLQKLKNTYIDTLPKLVHPETGRIHTSFNQSVAATGRLSSSDPNLQNIPIRTEIGRAIRAAFVAPEGHILLSADYSQIELRVLAHLSADPVLVASFRQNEDVHTRTAMEVFGLSRDQLTDEHRRRAKAINFGVIYGMGEVSLAKRLGIRREEAADFIRRYFERYQGVRSFLDSTLQQAREGQAVRTILGRTRHLPDLRSANRQLRAQAERIAVNTPIQGSAADLLKLAMVRLRQPVAEGVRMILTVHDELIFEVPEDQVQTASSRIRAAMENVMQLAVPLVVDIGTGRNWADAH